MAALRELNTNLLLTPIPNLAQLKSPQPSKRAREEDLVLPNDDSDDDDHSHVYKWNCNQVRTKINALIRSGEMKVTEVQRTNGVNSNSYGRFMKPKGPYGGIDNQTYHQGHKFFLKREKQGMEMPKAKKPKPDDLSKYEVNNIDYSGESGEELPVCDTCDDIRSKIQAHLRNSGVTQAAFLREIGNMYSPSRSIQSKQLTDFLKKKGATSGNTSAIYYVSYVYIEKLRIKNGDKKSRKRQKLSLSSRPECREMRGTIVVTLSSRG